MADSKDSGFTRRQYAGTAAAGVAAWAAGRPLTGLYAANGSPRRAEKYIDVHTHVGTIWNGNKELTASLLVRWMDEHDIAKAVVLPLTSPESSSFLCLTEGALRRRRRILRNCLIPFCSIDPRTSVVGGVRGFETHYSRVAVDQGAKGFGEHKVGLDFDDPLMMQIYEVCEQLGIPLLFHMDTIRGQGQAGPSTASPCSGDLSQVDIHWSRPRLVGVDLG